MIRTLASMLDAADQDLLGRFVLFDEGYVYPSYGQTLRVTKLTRHRIEGTEPARRYDETLHRYVLIDPLVLPENDGWSSPGSRGTTVRARKGASVVCDTEKEVNQVLAVNEENRRVHQQFLLEGQARFAALATS